MARRRRRRGRPSYVSSGWKMSVGIVLILLVVSVFGYGGYLYYDQTRSYVEIGKDDYCPVNSPLAEISVLLIDVTDKLNEVQKTSILNIVDRLVANVPRYGAIAIYVVSPDPQKRSNPVFFRCNPGVASEIDPKFGNPDRVAQKWRDGFRMPLDSELKKNLESESADSSPIMESIQWTAVKHFDNPEQGELPKKLVVISDFLQHTDGYSHYQSRPNFSKFEDSQYFRSVRAQLKGVDVQLRVIRRNTTKQNQPLEEFWRSYFRTQGSNQVSLQFLSG